MRVSVAYDYFVFDVLCIAHIKNNLPKRDIYFVAKNSTNSYYSSDSRHIFLSPTMLLCVCSRANQYQSDQSSNYTMHATHCAANAKATSTPTTWSSRPSHQQPQAALLTPGVPHFFWDDWVRLQSKCIHKYNCNCIVCSQHVCYHDTHEKTSKAMPIGRVITISIFR